MARVWIYDNTNTKKYKEAAQKAKKAGRQSPDRWQVLWLDLNGKQKSESVPTKTKAEARRSEIERTLLDGTYVDPAAAKVQFAVMADKWIDARHNLRRSTWWKYRGLLDNHVLPRWGELPLNKILKEDIEVWVAKLLKSNDDGGSGLGPSQARHAYRALAMVLGWCVPNRLPRNPAHGVKVPVLPEHEHTYLTYTQVEALAEASGTLVTKYQQPTACSPINPAFIRVLAYTGLRWGEAAALRIGRVNLANRRIRIVSTFYEVKGDGQLEGLPKTGKRRTVPIPEFLCPELAALIAGRDDDDLLFLTRRGQSLRANNWRTREFNPAITAAGFNLPGLTPHKLRHTAASLAIAAGADVKVIQTMLGHKDASMTLDIYGHLFPDRLDEVASALDRNRRKALQDAA
jgi:integrase